MMMMMDAMTVQLHKLNSMPLSPDDLHALKLVRRTIYSYGALFGLVGAGCGVAISGSSASKSCKLFSSVLFGAVSSFLGVSLGLQRGLVRLSETGGPLSSELKKLDAIRESVRVGSSSNSNSLSFDGLFNARLKKKE